MGSLLTLFDGEFSPRDLFRGGKNGTFLDLSQPYRFQGAAGTTAATADADPLGLVYDLKNGVPQVGSPLTLLADTATKSSDGTTTVNIIATSGISYKFVRVQFSVTGVVGSFTVGSTGTNGTSVTVSANGTYDIVVGAGATGGNIKFEGLTTSRFSATGIVVRELPGSHAYQAATTARPLLQSSPKRAVFDNSDDKLNIYYPAAMSSATIVREYTGIGYQLDVGKSVVQFSQINTDFGRYIVRDGALSAAEQATLEAYLGNNRKYMIAKSAGTTINNMRVYTGGASTDVLFIGANGAAVTKSLSLNSNTSYNVSSDGLTAPVFVVWPNSLSANTALLSFYCDSNQLTGSIPNLSANTALQQFNCSTNQLTGSIPNLSANTALQYFNCNGNQLTGSIPNLSANTALQYFYCYSNQLTGSIPNLSANTALQYFNCNVNQLTGSIPNLSANTALQQFNCSTNQLTGFSGGTVSSALGDFRANNNWLTQSAVDAILAAFVAAGRTTGTRILNLGGTGNAAPSAAGITDKNTLISRGWTVTTN